MRGLNVCQVMGSLGEDVELRYTATGRAVARMRVAVHCQARDAGGQLQERVESFRVKLYGRQAEIASQHLCRGDAVYVSGRLETTSCEGADGRTRRFTELVARELILLPTAGRGQALRMHEFEEV